MGLQTFERRAETGDILLFTGRNMIDNIQRIVTGSRFDHAAIVLRDSAGGIELFEAIGNTVTYILMIVVGSKQNFMETIST